MRTIHTGFTLLHCVFVCFALTCVHGQSPVPLPRIVVDSAIPDSDPIAADVKKLDYTNCKQTPRRYNSDSNVSDLVGGKVKKIRVLYTDSKFKPAEPEEIRKALLNVWQGKTHECCACGTPWDEGTFWSIDAVIEFEDGKKGVLITDGWHVALQAHDGGHLFFRLPATIK